LRCRRHERLFSPLSIGDLALPNRILMAPLTRSRATPDRVPTPMMTEHRAARRRRTDHRRGDQHRSSIDRRDCAPGIFTQPQIDAWKMLVRAVHAAGGGSRCSSGTAAASPATAPRIPGRRSRRPA
jgi:2,4-dienoyl-CoA reductase-like NADH-dependent reductase (Old Yellow Enzyme family)